MNTVNALRKEFLNPNDEFTPMPFWFWNGDLQEDEIQRQIHDFKSKGVMGFVIHPRIGIPEKIPYLSERFMALVRFAVKEAASCNMKVVLYDEGMYPSGSAHGMVVKDNPEFASRGLKITEYPCGAKGEIIISIGCRGGDRNTNAGHNNGEHNTADSHNEGEYHTAASHNEGEYHTAASHQQGKDNTTAGHNEIELKITVDNGENVVLVLAVQKTSEVAYLEESALQLQMNDGKICFIPPNAADWSVLVFTECFSGGTIRGIHFGEDDGEPFAPPSGDLLNPYAMQKFITLTHDKYYNELKEYFGSTIIAMFTDEPGIMGRNHHSGLIPWTGNFLQWYEQLGNSPLSIPALWLDCGENTEEIRRRYRKAVNLKLEASYYKPIADWCEAHHIALTGHPEKSDEIGLLKYFHIPGQDIVWRWVAPEDGKALEGEHSTMGKCSSDAARHNGRHRNSNECFGCCGSNGVHWAFSADDMKWYLDWMFVRGVNLLYPHAFFYSVDGERRFGERPPDVGPNNIWWKYYSSFSGYIKRLSWLMTDSVNQAHVCILCDGDSLPWKSAKPLFENQLEFNYLEDRFFLSPECEVQDGRLKIQNQEYAACVIEDEGLLSKPVREKLAQFTRQGGKVIFYNSVNDSKDSDKIEQSKECLSSEKCADNAKAFIHPDPTVTNEAFINTVTAADDRAFIDTVTPVEAGAFIDAVTVADDGAFIDAVTAADDGAFTNTVAAVSGYPSFYPLSRDLRLSYVVKKGIHFYLLTNEGDEEIQGTLLSRIAGKAEKWDGWQGETTDLSAYLSDDKGLHLPLKLARRESMVICIDPAQKPVIEHEQDIFPHYNKAMDGSDIASQNVQEIKLNGTWQASNPDGSFKKCITTLESWTQWPDVKDYTGIMSYETTFEINAKEPSGNWLLDMGEVHEIAHVYINGSDAGFRLWKPYILDITPWITQGMNRIRIDVTNSLANRYQQACLDSGLVGPVRLLHSKGC